MGALVQAHVSLPLVPCVTTDARQSNRYAVYLSHSRRGQPDRDHYLVDNNKFIEVRAACRKHVAAMLELLGEKNPPAVAGRVVELETEVAKAQWSKVDSRDADRRSGSRGCRLRVDSAPSAAMTTAPAARCSSANSYASGFTRSMSTRWNQSNRNTGLR